MKTAICSGSFDPITLGHLDIIQRSAACFDRVWVCVSPNAEKRNQMFTPEQKLQLVPQWPPWKMWKRSFGPGCWLILPWPTGRA